MAIELAKEARATAVLSFTLVDDLIVEGDPS